MNHRYGRAALIGVALASLLHEANKPRELATLPNTDGFRFTGHKLDGTKVQCVVRWCTCHENGRTFKGHRAYTVSGDVPIYRELCAWSPAEL